MSVSAQTPRNQYTGNGSQTAFTYTFEILAGADLAVYVGSTRLAITTDYTVSGAGVGTSGGTVTFVVAPATGVVITLRRFMSYLRPVDYQTNGSFYASDVNADIDARVLSDQQLQEQIARTIRLAPGDSYQGEVTEIVQNGAARASKIIGFDGSGNTTLYNTFLAVPVTLAGNGLSMIRVNAAGTGYELRTPTQTRTDIAAQPVDATLTGLSGQPVVANQVIYSTGVNTFGMAAFTGYARTLVSQPDAPSTRTALGLGSIATHDTTEFVSASTLGANNGTATLDGAGKLTTSQIPTSLVGALQYQGTWNAATNTPTLTSGAGTKGQYYVCNVAGSTTLDGQSVWTVRDWAVFDGTAWEIVQGGLSSGEITAALGFVPLAPSNNLSDVANLATARANLGIDKRTARGDANYTILATDRTVALNVALTAPRTWTLPAANSVTAGQTIYLFDEVGGISATNTLTIARAGSDTINGATTLVFANAYDGCPLMSDGSGKWSQDITGLEGGGTGATTAVAALSNLGGIGAATTNTLTNKTYDTAGTGNVFRINGTTISAIIGTGAAVLATSAALTTPTLNSPTMITPILGVATATSINGLTITSSTGTLNIANLKTLAASNTLTLAGIDATTITFQGTDTYVGRGTTDTLTNKTFDTAGTGNVFRINGTAISAVTGTGSTVVLSTAPTFTTQIATPYIATGSSGAGKTILTMTSNGAKYGTIQVESAAGNGSWSLGYQSAAGSTIGSPALTWDGAGNVTLANTLTYGGTTLVASISGSGGALVASNSPTLSNASLTGTPTAPTATGGTNTTQIATTAFVTAAISASGGGTVSSVAVSGGTTGLTTSGGPITSSGTITLSGTLAVANGGTGVTSSTGTGSNVLSASPTFTGTISAAAASLSGTLSTTQVAETYTAPTISAGTLTIDLSTGTVFKVANAANISTFTINNATASKASSFTLILAANGTGYTQAWGSVKWAGGTAPTITTTNAKKDILTFATDDGGTTWYGFVAGQNF